MDHRAGRHGHVLAGDESLGPLDRLLQQSAAQVLGRVADPRTKFMPPLSRAARCTSGLLAMKFEGAKMSRSWRPTKLRSSR